MKINKLAVLGGFAGIILMISSWIRYFIMYPDLDKAVIYGVVGFLIIAVSYLWAIRCKDVMEVKEKINKLDITLYDVEEFLANKSKQGKTYEKDLWK